MPDLDAARGAAFLSGPMRDIGSFIAEIREDHPVCWLPGIDAWLVSSHEHARALFTDPRVTSDSRVYEHYRAPTEPGAERWLEEMPFRSVASDPETLGRRLVSAALTPRGIARIEDRIRDTVERFAAPLRGRRGVVDLLGEFTAPTTATVIGSILGVPPKRKQEQEFRRVARKATRVIHPIMSDKKRRKSERAWVELCEHILELVDERRLEPRDDLISDLLRASHAATPASTDDVVKVITGLVSAGTGTANIAAARALRALLQNPDQLELLRRDPFLLPEAVNELLRYDAGIVMMPRYVAEPLEVDGETLRRGQLLLISVLGANHDPAVFPDPDRLDLTRDAKDGLTFGRGAHYCIGSNIARTQIRLIVEAALEFMPPGARLREDRIRWTEKGVLSQLANLPVDFGDARR